LIERYEEMVIRVFIGLHVLIIIVITIGRIFFAGTETTPHENGHMNGAVIAGNRIAKEIYRQFVTA
jgi:monoamine oxidase